MTDYRYRKQANVGQRLFAFGVVQPLILLLGHPFPLLPYAGHGLTDNVFECGDGWYELIDALCLNLQHATKNGAPQVVATQVKEKFGALSFHAHGVNDEQVGMIALAETFSARLCDVCGNRGRIRAGWVRCRCPQHEAI